MQKLLLTLGLMASAASLLAQTPLTCDGRRATVRISEISAIGTKQGFLDAVAAHKAWVASHGLTKDEITTVPVIVRDEATRARSYSDKQFLAIHIHGVYTTPEPKHDEAYDAFVKLYRDNSEVKAQYDVCLPLK